MRKHFGESILYQISHLHQRPTYKTLRNNTLSTATLTFQLSRTVQSIGIGGKAKMVSFRKGMLVTELARVQCTPIDRFLFLELKEAANFRLAEGMHLPPGADGSQEYARGVHWKNTVTGQKHLRQPCLDILYRLNLFIPFNCYWESIMHKYAGGGFFRGFPTWPLVLSPRPLFMPS